MSEDQFTILPFHEKIKRKSVEEYVNYCTKWGVDLSHHLSSRVDKNLLDWAEIVVIMDGHNYKMVRMLDPHIDHKLIWLGALSKKTPTEIKDPYGKSEAEQAMVVSQLAISAQALIDNV